MWVFRVTAKTEHEAMLKGLDQYKALMTPESPDQEKLFVHVRKQVGKLSRMLHEAMIIEIPPNLVQSARNAAEAGFFTFAGSDEVILNTSEVGWKAILARQDSGHHKGRELQEDFAFA